MTVVPSEVTVFTVTLHVGWAVTVKVSVPVSVAVMVKVPAVPVRVIPYPSELRVARVVSDTATVCASVVTVS